MPRAVLTRSLVVALFYPLVSFAPMSLAEDASGWPQWRGSAQNGVASGTKFPRVWSEDSGIVWKKELSGLGGSTPVTDGKHAYISAGVDGKNTLMAIDIASGDVSWKVSAGSDKGKKHRKGSGSNPSAVIDGDLVFAYYRSGDLICVDNNGNKKWATNLQESFGEDTLWWDLGSSPMLTKNAVVIAVMQSGPSYLVAYDKKSGDQLWKVDRMLGAPEEAAQSYATPIAVTVNGKQAIAVMGADHLTLHSAKDGQELGRLGGFNPTSHKYFRSISSPVAEGNIIVCPYARGDTITAVDMDALANGKGKNAIVWHRDDLGSDVPTPAAVNGRVYVVGDKAKGLISCLDIKTGNTFWEVQLPKSRIGYSSSPLVAGNYLYVTSEDATTYVIGPLDVDEPKVVATNKVADSEPFTVASPTPAGDSLLIRSHSHLYRVANP